MATDQYIADGLYAWTVNLANGETRQLLSGLMPADRFPWPVTSATRGPAYPPASPPKANNLVPASATIGGPNFTLHVTGTGFRVGDTIIWNGLPEPTTLVSATELTTLVNMATATTPMPIPVSVRALSGYTTPPLTFTLQSAG